MMTDNGNRQPIVVRTARGLSIAGTRITLAGIMDYLTEGWPPKLIRDWLDLTDEQIDGVICYIAAHRTEVEDEYRQVLAHAEEERRYWDARNREHAVRLATLPPATDNPEARAKLATAKARRPSA